VELDDEPVFVLCYVSSLQIGAKVINPPQPAALPAP
jgi:hypothetical protein